MSKSKIINDNDMLDDTYNPSDDDNSQKSEKDEDKELIYVP